MKKNNKKLIPELRFPEFLNDEDWGITKISEVLDYEQPTSYIVNDTKYLNEGTAVLTANKSFILGYTNETQGVYKNLPAIIFDDFTVDNKFVDFPFKVKSSAIKILKNINESDSLKFIYELMQQINFDAAEHKRYYISSYQNLQIPFPVNPKEQQKIADCLSSLDEVITLHEQKLTALEEHKKGLMQNLFPQEGETVPKYRFPEFVIDGDWEEKNILEIASMKARIGWQNLRTDEHLIEGEYYLVTGTDFKHNKIDWDKTKYVSYERYIQDENIILKEGDILITKDGSIGKVAYVTNLEDKKSTLNNGIFRIRINNSYKSDFVFHSFLSSRFKVFLDKLSGGSSIVHLYQKDFEKYEIHIPKNPKEQQRIAECLSSVDVLILEQSNKIDQLKEHKKGLMQGLFPKIEE